MKFNTLVRSCALFAVMVLLLCVSGCEYGSKVWHDTQEFVDPNPEINLNNPGIENPDENKLALLFTPVDGKLLELMNHLSSVDSHPDENWFKILFMRYPWISGVMTVDEEASILVKLPETSIKPFTPGPLVEYEGDWSEIKLKSFIDYSEFGPEMYLCSPYFKDGDFKGLVVIHFDPRVLLNFCPSPKDLIIMQPDSNGVWSGDDSVDKDGLTKFDWDPLLDEKVRGVVTINKIRYVWFSRYVGDTQILYLTKAVTTGEEEDSFLFF